MIGDLLKNVKYLPKVEGIFRRHKAYYEGLKGNIAVQIARGIQDHMMTCVGCDEIATPTRTLSDVEKEKLARLDDLINRALTARETILRGGSL